MTIDIEAADLNS